MQFVFFNAADTPLFVRSDAEQATWTVEEMNLVAVFPYHPGMVLQRGQRVGFTDETGVFQPFEIRKVETMLPDHYQRITAEHIVISELTDEHYAGAELTNVTAQAALTGLLTGTLWQVGTVTASGTQTADLGMGSVWQNIRTIESNWNVYITPRVTFNSSGITGRYLDIAPAQGTWRGVRLSLDKNADELGVVIDDTNVITAIYGYGAMTGEEEQRAPLTFANVVWQQTSDHPAKPSGQTYIEDPAATAAYGRNGRPRYGYYQNTDINDANVLIEKAWESLKVNSVPMVSVNCMVRDLYRLGYKDQPIRLHDTAMVELRQTGTNLQLEIIKLTVDLLDPTATRPTIGSYIPNIVYMMRQTAQEATGNVASAASGSRGTKRGGGGKSANDNKRSEFATEIKQNQYQISLRAYQTDMTEAQNILRAAGISINAQGVLVYATDNVNMIGSRLNVNADAITQEVTDRSNADTELSGKITVEKDRITQIVSAVGSNGEVTAASIVLAVNNSGSSVVISADHVDIDGWLQANMTTVDGLYSKQGITALSFITSGGYITAAGRITGGSLTIGNTDASWKSKTVVTTVSTTTSHIFTAKNGTDYTGSLVTAVTTDTIYYLGS
jgi:phage minor structural protein